jgi:two-component system sensor histidine kinase DesK
MTASALDPQSDAILGWAVREGATNVLRHSGALRCTIGVSTRDDGVQLVIADDGSGAVDRDETENGAGNGLRGLSERITAVGGSLQAGPPRDAAESPYGASGFLLRVRVPVAQEPAAEACGPGSRDAR